MIFSFVAESTLNISSITNVFDTMPVTNAFEALVGLPNFADNS
jgi:hypothetical protein